MIKEPFIFLNRSFDKKELKQLIHWSINYYGVSHTLDWVEQLKFLGFHFATQAGISIGVDDLKIPPMKKSLLLYSNREMYLQKDDFLKGQMTAVQYFQSHLDVWNTVSELLKDEALQYFRKTDLINPIYLMTFSGARGNISQVRQLVGMRGLMTNSQGDIIEIPITSNFREGLTVTEYLISCYGARKGLVDVALRTANAGYLTRRLIDVAHPIVIMESTCQTNHGIQVSALINEEDQIQLSLEDRLLGRLVAKTMIHKNHQTALVKQDDLIDFHLVQKLAEISSFGSPMSEFDNLESRLFRSLNKKLSPQFLQQTKSNLSTFQSNDCESPTLETKFLEVKSPLTCESLKSVCQYCYGWTLDHGRFVQAGEAVGILAAQSIGEPGTQLTLRTFHTGGIYSGKIKDRLYSPCDGVISYDLTFIQQKRWSGKLTFITTQEEKITIHKETILVPPSTILYAAPNTKVFKKQMIGEKLITRKNILKTFSGHEAQRKIYCNISGEIFFSTGQKPWRDIPSFCFDLSLLEPFKKFYNRYNNQPRQIPFNGTSDYKINNKCLNSEQISLDSANTKRLDFTWVGDQLKSVKVNPLDIEMKKRAVQRPIAAHFWILQSSSLWIDPTIGTIGKLPLEILYNKNDAFFWNSGFTQISYRLKNFSSFFKPNKELKWHIQKRHFSSKRNQSQEKIKTPNCSIKHIQKFLNEGNLSLLATKLHRNTSFNELKINERTSDLHRKTINSIKFESRIIKNCKFFPKSFLQEVQFSQDIKRGISFAHKNSSCNNINFISLQNKIYIQKKKENEKYHLFFKEIKLKLLSTQSDTFQFVKLLKEIYNKLHHLKNEISINESSSKSNLKLLGEVSRSDKLTTTLATSLHRVHQVDTGYTQNISFIKQRQKNDLQNVQGLLEKKVCQNGNIFFLRTYSSSWSQYSISKLEQSQKPNPISFQWFLHLKPSIQLYKKFTHHPNIWIKLLKQSNQMLTYWRHFLLLLSLTNKKLQQHVYLTKTISQNTFVDSELENGPPNSESQKEFFDLLVNYLKGKRQQWFKKMNKLPTVYNDPLISAVEKPDLGWVYFSKKTPSINFDYRTNTFLNEVEIKKRISRTSFAINGYLNVSKKCRNNDKVGKLSLRDTPSTKQKLQHLQYLIHSKEKISHKNSPKLQSKLIHARAIDNKKKPLSFFSKTFLKNRFSGSLLKNTNLLYDQISLENQMICWSWAFTDKKFSTIKTTTNHLSNYKEILDLNLFIG